MKTISVVITRADKFSVCDQTFRFHEDALGFADWMRCPKIEAITYSNCFNNLKQAREYVRLLNRKVPYARAMAQALGHKDGDPLYSIDNVAEDAWEMEIDGDPIGIAPTRDEANRLLGMLRLCKVTNDAGWEKLPADYRALWAYKPVFWMKESA